ncbi:MAG TPA: nitrogen fixation protein, partial [Thauera sp.]|nr:nitrogen fixation protein [Thauera sp.]
MRIAITSQNFRTVTAHAGKARRFLVFDLSCPCLPREIERLDLPK